MIIETNPTILAQHEAGHAVMMKFFNFEFKFIDIRDATKPQVYPNYTKHLELLISKFRQGYRPTTNEDEIEFLVKYIYILSAGHITESLFESNFEITNDQISISFPIQNHDYEIISKIIPTHILSMDELRYSVVDLLLSAKTCLSSLVEIILENSGLLEYSKLVSRQNELLELVQADHPLSDYQQGILDYFDLGS